MFLSRLAFLRLGWSRGRAETEFSDSDPKVSTREMAPVERAEVTNSPHEIVFEFFMPIHPTFGQDLSATACVTVQAGCPTAGMQRLRALAGYLTKTGAAACVCRLPFLPHKAI